MKILLIGASIAGISAASRLSAAGHQVALLDRRKDLFDKDNGILPLLAIDDAFMLKRLTQWQEAGWVEPAQRLMLHANNQKIAAFFERPSQFKWRDARGCFTYLLRNVRTYMQQSIENVRQRDSGLFADLARHTQIGPFDYIIDARTQQIGYTELSSSLEVLQRPSKTELERIGARFWADYVYLDTHAENKYQVNAYSRIAQNQRSPMLIDTLNETRQSPLDCLATPNGKTALNCVRLHHKPMPFAGTHLLVSQGDTAVFPFDFQNLYLAGLKCAEKLLIRRH